MYPFANPGYQLAHEVTPSVILRKCISKSFFPLSWLPGNVSFSSLRYTETEKALILTHNIYISSHKKKWLSQMH